jgi:hypothetical protein
MTRRPPARTCGATTRAGHPCRKPAGWGTPFNRGRCKLHGGATPNGQLAARLTVAREHVEDLGLPATPAREDPGDILLEEVRRSATIVRYLHGRVLALGDDLFVDGGFGIRVTSEWVTLWERQRRHLADVCTRALHAGVARRQVELAEAQGELAGKMMMRVLHELGIDVEAPTVRSILRRQLELITNTGE